DLCTDTCSPRRSIRRRCFRPTSENALLIGPFRAPPSTVLTGLCPLMGWSGRAPAAMAGRDHSAPIARPLGLARLARIWGGRKPGIIVIPVAACSVLDPHFTPATAREPGEYGRCRGIV